jgi:thioredoxin-related protein
MLRRLPLVLFATLTLTSTFAAEPNAKPAEPEYPKLGPDLYDPKSDGNAQIAAALITAKTEKKNVLLMFGANWCIWCRRLDRTFASEPNIAAALKENYVLVLIDSNWRNGTKRNEDLNLRYGNPLKEGLPVLVVLDATGQQLTTQETGALEDGGSAHDPAKVGAFLARWAPKR